MIQAYMNVYTHTIVLYYSIIISSYISPTF
jgi:hypothetical protein